MEKIDEQLNNLSFIEVPVDLHQSVMKKVHYRHLRPVFLVAFSLLTISFFAIVWYINIKLVDAEFLDMAQDFFDVFNFDFSFVNTILESFFEIISPALFMTAVLSLAGMVYIGKKITVNQFYRLST